VMANYIIAIGWSSLLACFPGSARMAAEALSTSVLTTLESGLILSKPAENTLCSLIYSL